ncbi:enoyl-CoA hydratase/isomerase family protein [Methyloversatilis sp.]|uniref:enoyl-CoA hydratase/isomerase family protein n=1 Tax=Methyloversatilis sp. TaxID=2569862 RepID=UPI00273606EA|nr:enoyl-CoA hydratase-related protein [Methyloversatilis sp.]MDP2867331.1 enoyl-CoA hydratase-related protein [Methyloversatilis sp.]MDP3456955.1 enoyl-CoA hydratase-related protein [Methyloversatilis sp.]MDP3579917.1 enoyl-CoA hydratase-related protein [Methyloversatilis sp.]
MTVQTDTDGDGRILTRFDGGVATLTMSRPARRNAYTSAMMRALRLAVDAVLADPACETLVLRGDGTCFSAGGDVHEFAQSLALDPAARQALFEALIAEQVNPVILALRAAHQPVIAAVRGDCVGYGLSLMLASDFALAADDALFSTAGIALAQPGAGGQSAFLSRALGERRARELMWSARRFDAHEAKALGLVERVVPVADFEATLAAEVTRVARGPRHAFSEIKRLLNNAGNGAAGQPLADQLSAEAAAFGRSAAGDDFAEAVRAFVARRKPQFRQAG